MEVLSNGMKVKFWVPIEEEPDIDRFVDEQIMIDLDRFMLVGTLEKVNTCKKKNEEKEYEYFKQITVQVNNICLASDNNFNISIPGNKDEFLYDVKFRYVPEPEQVAGDDMEPVTETEIEQIENDAEALDIDAETDEILGIENETPDVEAGPDDQIVVTITGPEQTTPDADEKTAPESEAEPDLSEDEIDALFDKDGAPTTPDDDGKVDDDDDFSFEDEPACNAIIDPDKESDTDANEQGPDTDTGEDDDDDSEIDWGD